LFILYAQLPVDSGHQRIQMLQIEYTLGYLVKSSQANAQIFFTASHKDMFHFLNVMLCIFLFFYFLKELNLSCEQWVHL